MNSPERRNLNILLPISILVTGLLIATSIYLNRTSIEPEKITVENPTLSSINLDAFIPVSEQDHILGDPETADVVIVDYSDLECPFCKQLHETFLRIYNEYSKTGKIAWVYRHFPLSIHSKAVKQAEATECVAEIGGDEAFWEYTHTIFANTPSNDGLDMRNLSVFAEKVGINKQKFETCLNSGKYASKIKEDYENALKLIGSESTPFTVLIVRGKIVPLADKDGIGFGALPYVTMKALIDEFVNGGQVE